jgi:hypothetical protein
MIPELIQFVHEYPDHALVGLMILVGLALGQMYRLSRLRADRDYKLALLDRGLSVEEVQRLTAGGSRRWVLFDQFAALSGGAKAGLIILAVRIANMVLAATMAIGVGHQPPMHVEYRTEVAPPRPAAAPVPMPAAADEADRAEDDGGC